MKAHDDFKEYTIVMASSPKLLIEKVNEHLDNGWYLIGGLCIASVAPLFNQTSTISCQAMAK